MPMVLSSQVGTLLEGRGCWVDVQVLSCGLLIGLLLLSPLHRPLQRPPTGTECLAVQGEGACIRDRPQPHLGPWSGSPLCPQNLGGLCGKGLSHHLPSALVVWKWDQGPRGPSHIGGSPVLLPAPFLHSSHLFSPSLTDGISVHPGLRGPA